MCVNIFYKFISYKKYYSDKKVKLIFFMCFLWCFLWICERGHWRGEYGGTVAYPHLKPNPYFTPILPP